MLKSMARADKMSILPDPLSDQRGLQASSASKGRRGDSWRPLSTVVASYIDRVGIIQHRLNLSEYNTLE